MCENERMDSCICRLITRVGEGEGQQQQKRAEASFGVRRSYTSVDEYCSSNGQILTSTYRCYIYIYTAQRIVLTAPVRERFSRSIRGSVRTLICHAERKCKNRLISKLLPDRSLNFGPRTGIYEAAPGTIMRETRSAIR